MKQILFFAIFLSLGWRVEALSEDKAAYEVAKSVIPEAQQKKVISFFGRGTPTEIKMWFIKFQDSQNPSNVRVVVVENGKVERQNTVEGQPTETKLLFDPASCKAGVKTALKTAAAYARESVIPFDSTRVYLNRFGSDKPPVWTVELIDEGRSQGFIYANAKEGGFSGYRSPSSGAQNVKGSPTSSGKT